MKKETVKISKAINGYIITHHRGMFIAKDKEELNLELAKALDSVIPTEMSESIELEIALKDS